MFNNKFELNEIKELLLEQVDIVFLGGGTDERCSHIPKSLTAYTGKFISITADNLCDKVDLKIEQKGTVEHKYNIILLKEFRDYLQSINIEQKKILIDITGMQHGVLFFLTKLLFTDLTPQLIFAAYTEPEKYVSGTSYLGDDFALTEEILGLNSIPGFARRDKGQEKVLIALLGFEGKRLKTLLDEIQPSPKKIIPVVGFPSYMPGWKTVALLSNSNILNSYDCFGEIQVCDAACPHETYKLLLHFSKANEGKELIIAPLGTRPHALGAAMYAALNSNCTLIYDFPVEKGNRTEGVLKTNIYHLSKFLADPYDAR